MNKRFSGFDPARRSQLAREKQGSAADDAAAFELLAALSPKAEPAETEPSVEVSPDDSEPDDIAAGTGANGTARDPVTDLSAPAVQPEHEGETAPTEGVVESVETRTARETVAPPVGSETASKPSKPATRPRTKTASTPSSAAEPEGDPQHESDPDRRVKRTIYLPGPVMEELRTRCQARSVTYAELVLVVFDEWYDRLEEVFPAPPPRRSSLPARHAPRRSRVPGLTQLHVMFSNAEFDVLTECVERLHVASVSELISGVLEAAFGIDLEYRRALRDKI